MTGILHVLGYLNLPNPTITEQLMVSPDQLRIYFFNAMDNLIRRM